jgi:hypothetical protein
MGRDQVCDSTAAPIPVVPILVVLIVTIPAVAIPVIPTIIDIGNECPRRCLLSRSRCHLIRELVGKGHCRTKGDETSDEASPTNHASFISSNQLALRHDRSFLTPPLNRAEIPEPLPLFAIIYQDRSMWNESR